MRRLFFCRLHRSYDSDLFVSLRALRLRLLFLAASIDICLTLRHRGPCANPAESLLYAPYMAVYTHKECLYLW